MAGHPELAPEIVVLPGTDVEEQWKQFHVFEALHHRMRICNPMHDADVDRLVALLDPGDGDRMLDIACGHGELLLRVARDHAIEGVGVDLSPWVLTRAAARARTETVCGSLGWWLGNAQDLAPDGVWDVATCIGASWIWHGFEGTVRALARRTRPGARVAVGDLRLLDGADPGRVATEYGRVLTRGEQEATLAELGIEPLAEIVATDAAWDGYERRIDESAVSYLELHPGEDSLGFLEMQREWTEDHARDRQILAWSVWVGRRA